MKNIIEIQNLVKKYSGNTVLDGVNLCIAEWDFFALLGYNGAGKSTTINILTNLTNKNDWKVIIDGIDIDENFPLARTKIGVVPQEFNFDVFAKVIDICILQAGYYGVPRNIATKRVENILKKLWLWEKRNSQARQLSGGMKRRLMIARALIHEPKILILDEPTAGVDVELRQSMWEFIKEINEKGTTIILTTHYLEEVEALCKNMAILSNGKIIKQAKVDDILRELDEEIMIFETKDTISLSEKFLQKNHIKKISEKSFEMPVKKETSMNTLFDMFREENLEVMNMRNKQNRVEALFMKYLQK